MRITLKPILFASALALAGGVAIANPYDDTAAEFKQAGESAHFFAASYAYAVFPTIGKGGLAIGAAHGTGRVYRLGAYAGDTSMTQVSFGFQAGGQAYSEIIFFRDKSALEDFESGHFEMGADVSAVAITASAGASATTGVGASASASGSEDEAATAGAYHHGIAVFTIAKGGAMYEAAIAGQKFSYKPVRVASE
jgi:lipid-binding SYLF domain-containing protein